jgi:hypothetical protein
MALVYTCREVHTEYLSHFITNAHVGVSMGDVEGFLRTFCRTFHDGQRVCVRLPKSITIYIGRLPSHDNNTANIAVNVLPLVRLHMDCPQLIIRFLPDSEIDWKHTVVLYERSRVKGALGSLLCDGRDLERILGCIDMKWISLIKEERLAQLVVHLWLPSEAVRVEIVYKSCRHDAASMKLVYSAAFWMPAALGWWMSTMGRDSPCG